MINLLVKLNPKHKYIISVSGGVDSMVLLDYLYHRKFFLIVVHFNHLKRQESIQDKILIQEYCANKKIPFHYVELNISTKNFQSEASLLRKIKLKEIATKYKTNYILTAHHLDDLAETIFLKVLRGSSLSGYSGMQDIYCIKDFLFMKPFLYTNKTQIRAYANKNQIPFLEDSTNQSDRYTRNKIRNYIIPFFKQENNFLKNIKKFHLQISEISAFLRQQTYLFLSQQINPNILDIKMFVQLHIAVQKDVILYLLEQNQISKNFIIITNIIKGIHNHNKPNIIWKLNKQWNLVKIYNQLFFQIKPLSPLQTQVESSSEPALYWSVSENKYFNFTQIRIYFDDAKISFPLKIRKRQPGDILYFAFGKKKLKKFFIDKKIALFKRNQLWLVTDQNNQIIWIPHLYINKTLGDRNILFLGLQNV
ncbi:tRNA lysidine(34) synthetase TilS [Candidatus Phytoplasma melaleucae]|uniref:tRNA(Ile)-lysidine synthase n=1 Tax=Candidatus Phytoplasma melaleucae TaxID=2982630 RepID=A0ABT9DCM7_9MOLU|nr:tRNA lysidine(34) synthetase TilS ['Melaleuca sp.' phytoplasma]MDO8167879.1 tRNA lysidine(34) synthetase TilS ['Melaleuca sp.' phytoplasma]MDV3205214.1 tRNA lysidine(34) synthetase TilS [Weeping tea tree witches'-broom phytoplasma]